MKFSASACAAALLVIPPWGCGSSFVVVVPVAVPISPRTGRREGQSLTTRGRTSRGPSCPTTVTPTGPTSPASPLWMVPSARREGETNSTTAVDLPDFTTSVQVDQIKLSPPPSSSKSSKTSQWRRPDLFGSSLVDQTLEELELNVDFQSTREKMNQVGLDGMTKEERTRRRRALTNLGIPTFAQFLSGHMTTTSTTPPAVFQVKRSTAQILQINIGLYCNQACGHCHVESSPLRTEESMSAETAARCLHILQQSPSIRTLDITGGAPELNPHFRYVVTMARALRPELEIIDRCNLTVLQEPGQEDLVDFLKQHQVHIIASLPCYSKENVDTQRGSGVFERSIASLLALNDAGYGTPDHPTLKLDLVYNPLGAFLPPPQDKLEEQYKIRLEEDFGILFDSLLTITNMPIKRFADFLHRRGELQDYMSLLVRNFNKNTVEKLMCLDTVSIGWDGQVRRRRFYDFDLTTRRHLFSQRTHDHYSSLYAILYRFTIATLTNNLVWDSEFPAGGPSLILNRRTTC